MSIPSTPQTPHRKKDHGMLMVLSLLGVACLLSVALVFVYTRSENEITKSFLKMEEMGKTLNIEGCIQKNLEWYASCNAQQQLCDQSISKMMRVCLVNGDKNLQCAQYGNEIYGYNFGAKECIPYFSNKSMKKACADTYQTVADFCKAVRKLDSVTKSQNDIRKIK